MYCCQVAPLHLGGALGFMRHVDDLQRPSTMRIHTFDAHTYVTYDMGVTVSSCTSGFSAKQAILFSFFVLLLRQ